MSRLLPSAPDLSLGDRDPRVVGVEDEDAEELIAALSSETARNALTALHDQPATTSELATEIGTSLQNIQYHLGNLREAELVEVVDTAYSEKGREMNVYAPADEPLVLFAGRSTDAGGLKTALKRLLGGYGIIGLAALAAQSLLSVSVPDGARDDGFTAAGGDDATADGDDAGDAEEPVEEYEAAEEEPATETFAETEDATFDVTFDGEAAESAALAAEYAVSLLEPGVVFFLGAALVFTVVWGYWYRESWRRHLD